MASVGNWTVGVSLNLESNISKELGTIAATLKSLRGGEIKATQEAFASLNKTMLNLGKQVDSEGKVTRNTFNALSKSLDTVNAQTQTATESVSNFSNMFLSVKDMQAMTFKAIGENLNAVQDDTKATTTTMNALATSMGNVARASGRVKPPPMPGMPGVGGGRGGAGGSGGMGVAGMGGGGHGGGMGGHLQGFLAGALLPGNMVGANAMMIGMAVRDGVISAIDTSGQFQQYLNIAANMGDMTPAQKAKWSSTMLTVSGMTGISPVDTMHSSLDVVRLMKGTMKIDDMADMAPKLFKAAKVLEVTRGYDPTKAIDNLVEITHMLHDYKPKSMKSMLDLMLGASELISQDPAKLKTQMAFFAGSFKNAGVSDKDTFASIVMAARAGMGSGKGGTSLNNFLAATLGQADLTNFRAALRTQSVQKIIGGNMDHFYRSDKAGQPKTMHIMEMLENLSKYATSHPGWQSIPELNKAFGIQGGRFASLLSDPETVKAFAGTRQALDDPKMNVENLYKSVMNNLPAQMQRVGNSFALLAASMSPTIGASIANVARSFADMISNFSQVVSKNPHLFDAFRPMLDGLANTFVRVDKYIQQNPQSVAKGLENMVHGIEITGMIFSAIYKIGKWFVDVTVWNGIVVAFKSIVASVQGLNFGIKIIAPEIGKHFAELRDKIGSGTKWVLDGLRNLWNTLMGFFRDKLHLPVGGDQNAAKPQPTPTAVPSPPPRGVQNHGPSSMHAQADNGAHGGVVVNVYGDIYGHDDFEKKVGGIVQRMSRHPMSSLNNNNSSTRTHPNIPQVLSVGTA